MMITHIPFQTRVYDVPAGTDDHTQPCLNFFLPLLSAGFFSNGKLILKAMDSGLNDWWSDAIVSDEQVRLT